MNTNLSKKSPLLSPTSEKTILKLYARIGKRRFIELLRRMEKTSEFNLMRAYGLTIEEVLFLKADCVRYKFEITPATFSFLKQLEQPAKSEKLQLE